MSLKVSRMIDELMAKEGGYSDDPDDRGRKTKYGVTEKVARRCGYRGDMRFLPLEKAKSIYLIEYWQRPQFMRVAEYSEKVAFRLFDGGVNQGTKRLSAYLQRALNAFNNNQKYYSDMTQDGYIGEVTLKALSLYLDKRGPKGEQVLETAVQAMQAEHYIFLCQKDPRQEKFAYGWFSDRVILK